VGVAHVGDVEQLSALVPFEEENLMIHVANIIIIITHCK
jgi:hypothetical protein